MKMHLVGHSISKLEHMLKDGASFCYCAYVVHFGTFGFVKEFAL